MVEWLSTMMGRHGHQVEKVYLPQSDEYRLLEKQMMAFRFVDLSSADRMIAVRPQAHLVPHDHKILWFIHHIRGLYDLWNPDDYLPEQLNFVSKLKDRIHAVDTLALKEAKAVYTNSITVSDRLMEHNRIESTVLYPPILDPERFHCTYYSDEILCIGRVVPNKRQHLLLDALRYTKTDVKLRLVGPSGLKPYCDQIIETVKAYGLQDRVFWNDQWISEAEKVQLLTSALGVAYVALKEDSYGYASLEASLASKPVLTVSDAGGVMELIEDGINGYVVQPNPKAIADAMDRLFLNRRKTMQMGKGARDKVAELNISWDNVIETLCR